jgi:2'-5' RNA ligase
MKKFSEIIKKETETQPFIYEYGCVMLYFNVPKWNSIIKNIVKYSDIYDVDGYKYETESHVTLIFGLHQNVTEKDVKNVLKYLPDIEVELKHVNIFENKDFDVVKFDIDNYMLNELNIKLQSLPNTKTFDVYHPHMTIAYVKQGKGKKYIQNLEKPIKIKPSKIVYSLGTGTSENKKIEISI